MSAPMRNFCRKLISLNRQIRAFRYTTVTSDSEGTNGDDLADREKVGYRVSKEDFQYVEKLIPMGCIPEPPECTSYPTPSGWYPQREDSASLPYFIRRTKNHMYPVYEEVRHDNQLLTKVAKIEGDIWLLEKDLRNLLQDRLRKKMTIQVHEIARALYIKGHHSDIVVEFMKEKGF